MSIKSVVCLPLAALLLAGCQSYQRLPLDLAAHQAAWQQRDPASQPVSAYARELAALGYESGAKYDLSDGLSLPEAEIVAMFFNPQLRAARLKARVPAVGAAQTGRWEDPELGIDAERIIQGVENPWVLGATISFTLPLSGRLGAEKGLAYAQADVELLRAYLLEVQTLGELRARWLEWSARQQQIALTRQYVSDLDEIVQRAERLRKAGEIDLLESRLFRIERTSRAGELRTLEMEQREQEVAIKTLLGLAPEANVQLTPTLVLPLARTATEPSSVALMENTPRLKLARAEYEAADRALKLEIRRQYPDVKVGTGPGTEEGDSRVLFGLSLPLPILNANRRAIVEARATRDATKADAEARCEELVSDLARARLAYETAQVRRHYLEEEIAPLVDQQVADARKLGKLGDATTLISLEAYARAFETKIQVLEARLKEASVVNQINTLTLPAIPGPSTMENKP